MTTGKAKVIGSFEPLEGDDLIRANELKRRDDRHSIAEAILRLQAETGKHFALDKAVFAGAIKSYAPGDDKDPIVCEPHQRDMREEVYWDDVIKWIAIEFPRFKYPVTPIPAASVVTAGAPGGVEPVKPEPLPLPTGLASLACTGKQKKNGKSHSGTNPNGLGLALPYPACKVRVKRIGTRFLSALRWCVKDTPSRALKLNSEHSRL